MRWSQTSLLVLAACGVAAAGYDSEKAVDCAELGDGFYALGCNKQYTRCLDGKALSHDCPKSLRFNTDIGECDYEENVKVCQDKNAKPVLVKAVGPFSCEAKADGSYSPPWADCSPNYYVCNYGHPAQMHCGPNQYFDVTTGSCDYKENVKACDGADTKHTDGKQEPAGPAAPSTMGLTLAPTVASTKPSTAATEKATDAPTTLAADEQKTTQKTYGSIDTAPPSPPVEEAKDEEKKEEKEEEKQKEQSAVPDCSSSPDSVLPSTGDPCTPRFWNCVAGRAYKNNCPSGLFFDSLIGSCDYKETVAACGGVRNSLTTAAPVVARDFNKDFDCSQLEDGYHPLSKCSTAFAHCSEGKTTLMECPDHLVFDPRIMACEYPLACEKQRDTPESVDGIDFVHGGYTGEEKTDEKKEVTEVPAANETEPTDTTETEATTEAITEATTTTAAPEKTRPATKKDKYTKPVKTTPAYAKTTLPATADATDSNATTASAEATTPASDVTETEKTTAAQDSTTVIVPNCSELDNGAHAYGRCDQRYFLCWGGSTTLANCPADLVYNPYNGQCDYDVNVPECGKGGTVPPATTTPAAPAKDEAVSGDTTTEKAYVTEDSFCFGRSDGVYSAGCQKFFYHCREGVSISMHCPRGLFYDQESKLCSERQLVPACNPSAVTTAAAEDETTTRKYTAASAPTVAPTDAATDAATTLAPSTPAADQATTVKFPVVEFDCKNKEDGLYSIGKCSQLFAQCMNHQLIISSCQATLYYNKDNGFCDWKQNVVECGGSLPTTAAAATVPAVSTLPPHTYGGVQTGASAQPAQPTLEPAADPTVAPFSCGGKSDGYYVEGCSGEYYACVMDRAVKLTCPSSLKFNVDKQMCDYPESFEACGGKKTTTTPAPSVPTAAVTIPTDMPADMPASPSCSSLSDGFYPASPCSAGYFSCASGYKQELQCPGGLVYDEVTVTCNYRASVAACGASNAVLPLEPSILPHADTGVTQTAGTTVVVTLPTAAPTLPARDDDSTYCVGKADGLYQFGCQAKYIVCATEIAYPQMCTYGLVFDKLRAACQYPRYVSECTQAGRVY